MPAPVPAPIAPLSGLQALGVLALCAFCGLGGGAITFLGSSALVNAAALTAMGATTDGVVTDARVMRGSRSGLSYEVRYAFTVEGERYTAEDETGRTNLWESLYDEPTWQAANATRRIQIQYLPSNPHVNRPLAGTGASFGGDQAAGLCLGLALLLPSLLIALATMRGQVRRVLGR
jgi:hypothetical protein